MTNKEAIRRIKDHMRIHKMKEPRAIYITQALELAIKALEERPTGKWIWFKDGYYKCDKCGEVERAKKNFCSKCGADMRERQ
jgi:hypothetical protein